MTRPSFRRAAGLTAAGGMLLAVFANVRVDCDAYLSSDALDCQPWGPIIDFGHMVAALGVAVMCVAILRATSSWLERVLAVAGLAVGTATAALHLLSATGIGGAHLFQPFVVLWAFFGIWIAAMSARRWPMDWVGLLGIVLGLTGCVWAVNVHDVFSDAVRLAGGGFFAIALPVWLIGISDGRRHDGPRITYEANRAAAAIQRVGIVIVGGLITVGFVLPFWAFSTVRVSGLGDPSWPVQVTNATAEPRLVALGPAEKQTRITAGRTASLEMGFAPRDVHLIALDDGGHPVYCLHLSARAVLHARLRLTVSESSPESCTGP